MARNPYDKVASRQLGLVTMAQLRASGWTRAQIRQGVRRAQFGVARAGVLRAAGSPRTREQAWLAAALAAEGSVLSHLTATKVWGYPFFPDPVGIDLLRTSSKPRLDGVVGHRTNHLPTDHVARHGALPVTSAARSLIDACGLVSEKQLRSTANDGLRRRILALPTLARPSTRCRDPGVERSCRWPGTSRPRSPATTRATATPRWTSSRHSWLPASPRPSNRFASERTSGRASSTWNGPRRARASSTTRWSSTSSGSTMTATASVRSSEPAGTSGRSRRPHRRRDPRHRHARFRTRTRRIATVRARKQVVRGSGRRCRSRAGRTPGRRSRGRGSRS